MSSTIILTGGTIVNENKRFVADILIKNGRIEAIASSISVDEKVEVIDVSGKLILPG